MQATELVKGIRDVVIDMTHAEYRNILDKFPENATVRNWIGIEKVYRGFDNEQKDAFWSFVRMIQVNTVSHILGTLDGSSIIVDNQEIFELKTGTGTELLNGYLQDMFLEMEEGS